MSHWPLAVVSASSQYGRPVCPAPWSCDRCRALCPSLLAPGSPGRQTQVCELVGTALFCLSLAPGGPQIGSDAPVSMDRVSGTARPGAGSVAEELPSQRKRGAGWALLLYLGLLSPGAALPPPATLLLCLVPLGSGSCRCPSPRDGQTASPCLSFSLTHHFLFLVCEPLQPTFHSPFCRCGWAQGSETQRGLACLLGQRCPPPSSEKPWGLGVCLRGPPCLSSLHTWGLLTLDLWWWSWDHTLHRRGQAGPGGHRDAGVGWAGWGWRLALVNQPAFPGQF